MGWGIALSIFNKIGAVVVALVLVRLLSAEAFGQYGLVNALLMFAFTFSMQRFMEHSFHGQDQTEQGYAVHLGFGILLHVAVFTLLNLVLLLAPMPENFAAVRTYAHIGSLSILLNIPRIFYSVHLRRMLDWRRQRTIHLVAFALSATISIGLAASGFGVWALLAQNLAIPIPYIFDLVRQRPDLLRPNFSLASYGNVLRFGGIRSVSGILGVGQSLAEASVFTAVAGFIAFGFYGRAIGIATLASAWLGDQLHNIMYPIIARVEPGTLQAKRAAGLALRLVVWTGTPLAAALFVFNDTVVGLLYGSSWMEVAPLLQAVLFVTMFGTTLRGLALLLLTTEGPAASVILEFAQLLVCLAGLTFALPGGALMYAWFLAAGTGALCAATLIYLVARRTLSLADVAAAILPMSVLAAVAVVAANSSTVHALDASRSLLGLSAALAVTGAIAVGVIRLTDASGLAMACRYLPGGARIASLLRLAAPPS
jgi:PST family polysaccharide transporter